MSLLLRNSPSAPASAAASCRASTGSPAAQQGGQPVDWFYYVNGVQAPKGAAATNVHPGDHVWWDRHDWSQTERRAGRRRLVPRAVPATASAASACRCASNAPSAAGAACRTVVARLRGAGVPAAHRGARLGRRPAHAARARRHAGAASRADPAAAGDRARARARAASTRVRARRRARSRCSTATAAPSRTLRRRRRPDRRHAPRRRRARLARHRHRHGGRSRAAARRFDAAHAATTTSPSRSPPRAALPLPQAGRMSALRPARCSPTAAARARCTPLAPASARPTASRWRPVALLIDTRCVLGAAARRAVRGRGVPACGRERSRARCARAADRVAADRARQRARQSRQGLTVFARLGDLGPARPGQPDRRGASSTARVFALKVC